MSLYDPKKGQMHQFTDVRVSMEGTIVKSGNTTPGQEPGGDPIKNLSWKGDVEVGMFPGPHIVDTPMNATYLLYRGFTLVGGYVRAKHPTMGEFLFDFRNIQKVNQGSRGITLAIYQIAEHINPARPWC